MSGHEKTRAAVLAAMMVLSVFAAGVAFTGSAAADPPDSPEGADYELDVEPDNVTTGGNDKTVEVTINQTYDDGTLDYTLDGPDEDGLDTGQTTDNTFTVTDDFSSEGDYTVTVTDASGDTGNSSTAPITSKYDATLSQFSAAVNSGEVNLEGNLADDNGDGVGGESIAVRDPGDDTVSSDLTQNNGDFELNFAADETGTYDIFDPETGVIYDTFEVTPTELTVMSNQTEVTAGVNETVDFTVERDDDQINLSENNIEFDITQSGESVQSGGTYVDTDDDDAAEVYRVGIDADEDPSDAVNVTAFNDTAEGMTTLAVETTGVETNSTNPLTKGVRTGPIEFTATGPDGDEAGDNSEFRFVADGGTVELSFNDNDGDLEVSSGEDAVANPAESDDYELEDGESIVVSDDDDSDLNASAFAFNNSEESDLGDEVQLDVSSQTDDEEGDSEDTFGENETLVFEALNGSASPDQIPVTGESAVTVDTQNAKDEPFDRNVDLEGAGVDVNGDTGDDGTITFSVNPDRTGEIEQFTGYDDEFVEGDSQAPTSVQTDTVEVVEDVDEEPPVGDIDAQASQEFGDVTVGESATETVTVENDGDGPVTVDETSISGTDADEFEVVGGGADFTLEPDETQQISVEFAPDSAGEKSADLTIDTEDDGTETVSLSGTGVEEEEEPPEEEPENVLTIRGTGDASDYVFSVTDDLEKSTANGANINTGDEIRRGYVADGEVGISADSYTFEGTLETIQVSGDAEVFLNGERISDENIDDMRNKVIEFAGAGSAAQYDFAAANGNERIQKLTANNANINNGDKIFRTTGYGEVGISKDAFGFNGVIDSLEVDGDANVYVNGQQVNPDDEQDHVITIVGTGEAADYTFTAGSALDKSTANFANINTGDTVTGDSASGQAGTSADSFVYNGDISEFSVDGNVQVYVDGEQIDQNDVASEA